MNMRRGWRCLALPALVGSLFVLAAGCGVPTESEARVIGSDQVVTTVPPPTTTPVSNAGNVAIYFVDDGRLSKVERPVDQAATVDQALEQLLAGPTEEEQGRKLLSSIQKDTTLLDSVQIEGEVATVNLSSQYVSEGELYRQAAAQVVYTVTENSAASQVRIAVEGKVQSLPTDTGNLELLQPKDYRSLSPRL